MVRCKCARRLAAAIHAVPHRKRGRPRLEEPGGIWNTSYRRLYWFPPPFGFRPNVSRRDLRRAQKQRRARPPPPSKGGICRRSASLQTHEPPRPLDGGVLVKRNLLVSHGQAAVLVMRGCACDIFSVYLALSTYGKRRPATPPWETAAAGVCAPNHTIGLLYRPSLSTSRCVWKAEMAAS